MKHRVVITGMGAITPLGSDLHTIWNNLVSGKSGVSEVTSFDASDLPTRIAAEVKDFNIEDYVERREARRMDRFVQFAVAATQKALQDADIQIGTNTDPERTGVIVGSGIGGLGTWEEQHSTLLAKGPRRVSPFFIPMMIANMASGQIAIMTGAKGPNTTVVTACATGTNSIGDSYKIIERGDADVMICGGAEATILRVGMAGFCAARAMSTRNDEPERASRPFDKDRDGFVMGEGSGVLILESLDHALKRGARIYGEVIGYGMSSDAYHMTDTAPGGEGAVRCMRMAIRDAGIEPKDITYINAHGTSTPVGDPGEIAAIKTVFGEDAGNVMVNSTKSMTGHLLGAAGGLEAIVSTLVINHGIVPPTINVDNQDPECDLDVVPNESRKAKVDVAMSNSFGFGGHNATIIIRRYES